MPIRGQLLLPRLETMLSCTPQFLASGRSIAVEGAQSSRVASVFAYFAGNDLEHWQTLVGSQIVHTTYGPGVVVKVRRSTDSTIMLEVAHGHDQQLMKTYSSAALCNARFFQDLTVSGELANTLQTVREELARREEDARRREEEAAAARERDRSSQAQV
jgi:hypothetical protein